NGYYQTTLTNFERTSLRGSDRRFLYEESAFRPEEHDMLGFGPAAYSLIADGRAFQAEQWGAGQATSDRSWLIAYPPLYHAVKTVNPEAAADYSAGVDGMHRPWESFFLFDRLDFKLLYLTRKVATLSIDRTAYRACFGSDCVKDFPLELQALAAD